MRFIERRLFRVLTWRALHGNGGDFTPYEPWVYDAFDRFEREMEAFCRRSVFTVVV